jgi:hypothetical protein
MILTDHSNAACPVWRTGGDRIVNDLLDFVSLVSLNSRA